MTLEYPHCFKLAFLGLLACAAGSLAQAKPQQKSAPASSVAADRLGLTCARILQMNSTDWVAKFMQEKGPSPETGARAIAVYAKCYDARTDSLAAALAKKSAGPQKKARADFLDFEAAVKAFTTKALADEQPTPDAAKVAYARLYEKQFRYDFYRGYQEKDPSPQLTPEENDQFGRAKNRFGELIGLLPEDKSHEVHEAFGDIVGPHPVSLPMKLALYRYAIFILEPPAEKPFAPPPF
jgi:hypothetical protein